MEFVNHQITVPYMDSLAKWMASGQGDHSLDARNHRCPAVTMEPCCQVRRASGRQIPWPGSILGLDALFTSKSVLTEYSTKFLHSKNRTNFCENARNSFINEEFVSECSAPGEVLFTRSCFACVTSYTVLERTEQTTTPGICVLYS